MHWMTPALAGHQLGALTSSMRAAELQDPREAAGHRDLCAAVMSMPEAPPPAELQGCPSLPVSAQAPVGPLQGHYFVWFSHFSHRSTLDGLGIWQAAKAKLGGM